MKRLAILVAALAGCGVGVDPEWQLDHDRVIAVRADPPRIASGQTSTLDALLGRKGVAPFVVDPDTATVVSPTRLASALSQQAQQWVVTAPAETELDAVRAELGLEAGAPVPLRIRVKFSLDQSATKIVWLGELAYNPSLEPLTINGMDGLMLADLTVGAGVDIPLTVELDAETYDVNWLTSCGTMHDFDLPRAYLRVEPEDPQAGSLAIVARDNVGGVSWRVWSIAAQ